MNSEGPDRPSSYHSHVWRTWVVVEKGNEGTRKVVRFKKEKKEMRSGGPERFFLVCVFLGGLRSIDL